MLHEIRIIILHTCLAVSLYASDGSDIKGYSPVSVSAANYRDTDHAELVRQVETANEVNPPALALKPTAARVLFVFLPGEIYSSDPAYEEVCKLLTPALAKKGYINAADEQGIIREPDNVKLVLRLTYGEREWRWPAVRTDRLTWRDGLDARPKGRGLHTLGGDRVWDSRAGGNDDALSAAAENQSNTSSAWGKGNASATGGTGTSGGGGSLGLSATTVARTGYQSTRNFHLIVVDAFDYAELKEKGKSAKRLWTTFVSAPKEHGKTFADVTRLLIRNATPYFGETSKGLQVFTDARAEVTIGEVVEVPEPKE